MSLLMLLSLVLLLMFLTLVSLISCQDEGIMVLDLWGWTDGKGLAADAF